MEQLVEIVYAHVENISVPIFILSSMLGVVVCFLVLFIAGKITTSRINITQYVLSFLFIVSLCFLFQVTFYNREDGSRIGVRLIPFTGIFYESGINWKNFFYAFFNVFLFVPYGFIVRLMVQVYSRRLYIIKSLIICVGTTIIIEFSQLFFEKGYFETEDLICNGFGGFIGLIFAQILIALYVRLIHKNTIHQQEN